MPDDMKDALPQRPRHRLPAVDAMRGTVMILMTVDHASYAFNAGRYVTDSMAWYQADSAIPAVQFLVRWMTHVCAPTFVFLAGLALAFSVARKQAGHMSERRIDIDLLVRGLFIMAMDPLWMSLGFGGRPVFQVLYAIGGGLCCMALLRRMTPLALFIWGGLLLLGSEALAGMAIMAGGGKEAGPIGALLATGGRLGSFGYVLYPLIPWLAYMILGLGLGRLLHGGMINRPARWFAFSGIISLLLYAAVRGVNEYGNMLLYRGDMSFLQWLHVSKYPPSLSFSLMTMGMMGLGLAALFRIYARDRRSTADPLLVFGRTPLFFYLLHVHLLSAGAQMLGMWKTRGLVDTFLAAASVLVLLYPLCRWYARLKKSYPLSPLRYI